MFDAPTRNIATRSSSLNLLILLITDSCPRYASFKSGNATPTTSAPKANALAASKPLLIPPDDITGILTESQTSTVLAAVGMIIYGGYLWMTSGGEPDKKQRAQGTLTWSVVGLVFLYLIKMLLSILVDTITSGEIKL